MKNVAKYVNRVDVHNSADAWSLNAHCGQGITSLPLYLAVRVDLSINNV